MDPDIESVQGNQSAREATGVAEPDDDALMASDTRKAEAKNQRGKQLGPAP